MNKKSKNKKKYIPPKVEITRVVLENVIAASPVQKVNLKDWDYETEHVQGNNSDVILYF